MIDEITRHGKCGFAVNDQAFTELKLTNATIIIAERIIRYRIAISAREFEVPRILAY